MTLTNKSHKTDKESVKGINLAYKEKLLFYEKIFNSINAIVYVFDLTNFRMIWVNEGFKTLLGYKKTSKNIPEDILLDIHHPDDKGLLEEMQRFFEKDKKGTFTAVFQFRDVNGKYIWLCTVANVFRRNMDASILEIVGVSISFSNDLTYDRNLKIISREKSKKNNHQTINKLSKRELELIKYFANGHKTRDIAESEGLSFHTVNNHRKNIIKKLGLNNIAALVNFAIENGLN